MAEEPQPPSVHPGADPEDEAPIAPKSAEDRKTAAALSSLDSRGAEDEDAASGGAKSQLDQEALGKAMSRLEVGATKSGDSSGKGREKKDKEEESVKKKAVKVDQADVALLVSFFLSGSFGLGSREG